MLKINNQTQYISLKINNNNNKININSNNKIYTNNNNNINKFHHHKINFRQTNYKEVVFMKGRMLV